MEALRSPKDNATKPQRSGWKIKVSPKGKTQLTLQAAFDAGKLIEEAKTLKRKALNERYGPDDEPWEVSLFLFGLEVQFCYELCMAHTKFLKNIF